MTRSKSRNGQLYFGHVCMACRRRIRVQKNPAQCRNERQKCRSKKRTQDIPGTILTDSRQSDRRRDLDNDLTKEFVTSLIANGCLYCGETKSRMTLDRIDNKIGHLQTNVVPACKQCNLIRRDMPYMAWLVVVEGVKKAKRQGLFNTWKLF